jgi:hypothetical protein
MTRNLVCLSILAAIACSSPTAFLDVAAIPPALHLTNPSAKPVYYFAVERVYAARIDWAPCTTPQACPSVPPHDEIVVPYQQIAGYTAGAQEAIVYWWHLESMGGGGLRPDSIRAAVVRL